MAMRIIREEHQALAAMLHSLLFLVRGIREYRVKPNFDLFRRIVNLAPPPIGVGPAPP